MATLIPIQNLFVIFMTSDEAVRCGISPVCSRCGKPITGLAAFSPLLDCYVHPECFRYIEVKFRDDEEKEECIEKEREVILDYLHILNLKDKYLEIRNAAFERSDQGLKDLGLKDLGLKVRFLLLKPECFVKDIIPILQPAVRTYRLDMIAFAEATPTFAEREAIEKAVAFILHKFDLDYPFPTF